MNRQEESQALRLVRDACRAGKLKGCLLYAAANGHLFTCLSSVPIDKDDDPYNIICHVSNEDAYRTILADPNAAQVSVLATGKLSPETERVLRQQLFALPLTRLNALLAQPFLSRRFARPSKEPNSFEEALRKPDFGALSRDKYTYAIAVVLQQVIQDKVQQQEKGREGR